MNKTRVWRKDRQKLIKDAIVSGRIIWRYERGFPEGNCEDCKEWKQLDPDHKLKRSQGGTNDASNIDWVCRRCHDRRDNQADPLGKKVRKWG